MSTQDGASSPLVTYPANAARPGYNYAEYYAYQAAEMQSEYAPVPGDEDYVEPNLAEISLDFANMPQSDISQVAASDFSTPSLPSLSNSTNPVRFGASLSSASAANSQLRLGNSLLSSTSVAGPPLRGGVPSTLPGIASLSFAATTIPSVVPPVRSSITGETLANFSLTKQLLRHLFRALLLTRFTMSWQFLHRI
jgi:hypothetical protein